MKFFYIFLALLVPTSGFALLSNADKAQIPFRNYAPNPGVEFGKTGYTASAGTLTTTTTASNVSEGSVAFSWDGSATGQTLTSTQVTIPSGLYGANCLAKVSYKTAESTVPYVLEAIDGSSNVLGSATLNATSTFIDGIASFTCPSSSTFALRVRTASSAGNPAAIFLDQFWIGKNYLLATISQAAHYGGATWAATASCSWSTTSNSFGNFSADTDCTSPTSTNLQGNATAPATKVPGITFTSLPPGRYLIIATGEFNRAATSTAYRWRFHDGTTASNELWFNTGSATSVSSGQLVGWLNYTVAQSSITIQLQARNGDGTTAVNVVADTVPYDIQVYRFPTTSEQAVSVDQAGWKIDANISGANPSLGTSAVTSYTGIEHGSLTLTQNTGSATAWIPCSSTNDSSGTTCSAGNESVGVSFTVPYAGDYYACVAFSQQSYVGNAGAGGTVYTTFQIVETPNAAQTISQEGKTRAESEIAAVTNAGSERSSPFNVCSVFNFSSAGRKTLRLFYEEDVGGTVNAVTVTADADANRGQHDIHWLVLPVARAISAPIVVGGVSSNTTGQERIERAVLNCDAGSAITSQSGSWVSSIANIAGNTTCAVTVAAGIFSSAPTCVASEVGTNGRIVNINASSATSVSVNCQTDAGAACNSFDAGVICMGPK